MSSVNIEIEESLAALLHQNNQQVQVAGREMIVLELYRRGTISSGRAAELLGMDRIDFIQHEVAASTGGARQHARDAGSLAERRPQVVQ